MSDSESTEETSGPAWNVRTSTQAEELTRKDGTINLPIVDKVRSREIEDTLAHRLRFADKTGNPVRATTETGYTYYMNPKTGVRETQGSGAPLLFRSAPESGQTFRVFLEGRDKATLLRVVDRNQLPKSAKRDPKIAEDIFVQEVEASGLKPDTVILELSDLNLTRNTRKVFGIREDLRPMSTLEEAASSKTLQPKETTQRGR